MTRTRIFIVIGGGLTLAACGRLLWFMIADRSWGWCLGTVVYAALVIVTLIGMWKGKAGALYLSRVLSAILLGFGCWAVNFAWTFWIFEEPTLMDRILAVAHPQISVYLVGPAVWFLLSYLPAVRGQFKS